MRTLRWIGFLLVLKSSLRGPDLEGSYEFAAGAERQCKGKVRTRHLAVEKQNSPSLVALPAKEAPLAIAHAVPMATCVFPRPRGAWIIASMVHHRKRDSDVGGMRHLGRRLAHSINRCTVPGSNPTLSAKI